MPAGQRLRVFSAFAEYADRVFEAVRRHVVELRRDHDAPPSTDADLPPPSPRAAWIACHTRIGDSGMSMYVTPSGRSASMTAFTTAGVAAIVPASPTPLTPREFVGDGVSVRSVSKLGSSAA